MAFSLTRAAAPLLLGLLWNPQAGYATGLWLMLGLIGIAALVRAQRLAGRHPG